MDDSIIVYAITEKGPDIIHSKTKLRKEKIQEIALYHLLLVAQGTWHHKGVFILPIPVKGLNESHKALFYGFTINDPEQRDPRTNGTRYCCIIAFLSNKTISKLDIIEIQDKFDQFKEKLKDYHQLKTTATFTKIKTLITKFTTGKTKKKSKLMKKVKEEISSAN